MKEESLYTEKINYPHIFKVSTLKCQWLLLLSNIDANLFKICKVERPCTAEKSYDLVRNRIIKGIKWSWSVITNVPGKDDKYLSYNGKNDHIKKSRVLSDTKVTRRNC